jgi:hypothetical protein
MSVDIDVVAAVCVGQIEHRTLTYSVRVLTLTGTLQCQCCMDTASCHCEYLAFNPASNDVPLEFK